MITVDQLIELIQMQAAFCGAVLLVAIPVELALFQIRMGKRLIR